VYDVPDSEQVTDSFSKRMSLQRISYCFNLSTDVLILTPFSLLSPYYYLHFFISKLQFKIALDNLCNAQYFAKFYKRTDAL